MVLGQVRSPDTVRAGESSSAEFRLCGGAALLEGAKCSSRECIRLIRYD